MVEYTPLSPSEIQELRLKEARGELTPEDTMRFIQSTRAAFLSKPIKPVKAASAKKEPPSESVDFF